MRIAGKVVLISGASEGIGAACAGAFRERGARLSLTARSEDKLQAVGGADALLTPGDITEDAVRARVVERTVAHFGSLDNLINNAGTGLYAPSRDVPLDDVRRLFELNLFAMVAMVQHVLPHMKSTGGAIVNIGSIAGKMPLPWFTLYSASKYAVGAYTDGLRMELAGTGIRTITVCPGYVLTDFQKHSLGGTPPERVLKGRRFAITAGECAQAIVRGVERNSRTVVTPASGWILVALERLVPWLVDRQVAKINRSI